MVQFFLITSVCTHIFLRNVFFAYFLQTFLTPWLFYLCDNALHLWRLHVFFGGASAVMGVQSTGLPRLVFNCPVKGKG